MLNCDENKSTYSRNLFKKASNHCHTKGNNHEHRYFTVVLLRLMTFLFIECTLCKIIYLTFKSQVLMILSVKFSPFPNLTSIENGMYVSSENLQIKILSKPIVKAVISVLICVLIYKNDFRTIQFIFLANIKLVKRITWTSPASDKRWYFFTLLVLSNWSEPKISIQFCN